MGTDLAAAEEEALWDAKRNAVEQAVGVFLRARSIGRDFTLEEDEIRSRSEGFLKTWERLPGSQKIETIGNGRLLRLRIRATVALLSVLRRLSDMSDLYDDLERPRLRVQITGGEGSAVATDALIALLKKEGFDVATEGGPAEIRLVGRLECVPTVRLGDKEAPYGVGETVGTCRATLTLRVLSEAAEETLLVARAEGTGGSFQSDTEAGREAVLETVERLWRDNEQLFAQHLLARWAQERQEGHTVVVQIAGLTATQRNILRERLMAMRGFQKLLTESITTEGYTLRLRTRLDNAGLRRRLAEMHFNGLPLSVLTRRGPVIRGKAVGSRQ